MQGCSLNYWKNWRRKVHLDSRHIRRPYHHHYCTELRSPGPGDTLPLALEKLDHMLILQAPGLVFPPRGLHSCCPSWYLVHCVIAHTEFERTHVLVCVLSDGFSHLGCECREGRGSVSVYSPIHTQRLGHSEFSVSI